MTQLCLEGDDGVWVARRIRSYGAIKPFIFPGRPSPRNLGQDKEPIRVQRLRRRVITEVAGLAWDSHREAKDPVGSWS
jgi:hypothetical protein